MDSSTSALGSGFLGLRTVVRRLRGGTAPRPSRGGGRPWAGDRSCLGAARRNRGRDACGPRGKGALRCRRDERVDCSPSRRPGDRTRPRRSPPPPPPPRPPRRRRRRRHRRQKAPQNPPYCGKAPPSVARHLLAAPPAARACSPVRGRRGLRAMFLLKLQGTLFGLRGRGRAVDSRRRLAPFCSEGGRRSAGAPRARAAADTP